MANGKATHVRMGETVGERERKTTRQRHNTRNRMNEMERKTKRGREKQKEKESPSYHKQTNINPHTH